MKEGCWIYATKKDDDEQQATTYAGHFFEFGACVTCPPYPPTLILCTSFLG